MDKISETLGAMTPVEYPTRQLVRASDVDSRCKDLKKRASDNLGIDYEETRSNLKELIQDSMSLMPNLVSLVREAESPRMYESASAFIKMLAELNKDLLSISSDMEKGKAIEKTSETPQVQSEGTTVFIGTSDELFKSLSKRKEMKDVN